MEWAIEHCLTYGKPVAATMCIGPTGDHDGVSAGKAILDDDNDEDDGDVLMMMIYCLQVSVLCGWLELVLTSLE